MTTWIRAENGLPVPGTLCLVTITPRTARARDKPTTIVARYCKGFPRDDPGCWMSCPGSRPVVVTHWMELPATPEGL